MQCTFCVDIFFISIPPLPWPSLIAEIAD